MKRWIRNTLIGAATLAAVPTGYVLFQGRAYDQSMDKVYDVPLREIARSTDPTVLARGKHLAETMMPCLDCHAEDLAGGHVEDVGPIMVVGAPNITAGGLGAAYTDAELFRLLRHGVKMDDRSVRLMPVQEWNWLPDADLVAAISFVRSMPASDRPSPAMRIKAFGKVLDRRDSIPIDVARRIDHANIELGPAVPAPTAEYGKWVGRLCTGCHGPGLSGGPIPGAPPSLPPPLNLTPHATGLAGITYEQFVGIFETGKRRNGNDLNAFMPVKSVRKMDETEKRALFAYLTSVPARAYGQR